VHQILSLRTDPSQDSEDGLNEEWWLDEFTVHEVCEVVEMTYVVALKLEPRAVRTELGDQALDLLGGTIARLSAPAAGHGISRPSH
jgi:hypothetical protein